MTTNPPLAADRIQAHNAARMDALRDEYDSLGRALARRGADIEAIKAKVAEFSVALPTWGSGRGGTRFAKFPMAGEPTNIHEKLADCAVTAINAGDYGRLLHDLYQRRELIALGEDVVNRAYATDLVEDAARQIERAEQGLYDLATRGSYEGGDLAGVSQGLIAAEKTARLSGDQVNAQSIQALQARMPAGTGALATSASVSSLQQAMVTAFGRDQTATARCSSIAESGIRPNSLAKNSLATSVRIWARTSGASLAVGLRPAAKLAVA